MSEQWRDIPGYEGHYQISDHGQVLNCHTGKLMKCSLKGRKGLQYPGVTLTKDCAPTTFTVHRLVALAFIGARPDGAEINHINGNKMDARVSNLEYVTHKANMAHAAENNLMASGARHFKASLTQDAVDECRRLWNEGQLSLAEIANRVGSSAGAVWHVLAQRTWTRSVRPTDKPLVITKAINPPTAPVSRKRRVESEPIEPAPPPMPSLNELTAEQLALVQQWQNQRLAMNEAAAEGKFTFADGCLTIMRDIELRLGFRPTPLKEAAR